MSSQFPPPPFSPLLPNMFMGSIIPPQPHVDPWVDKILHHVETMVGTIVCWHLQNRILSAVCVVRNGFRETIHAFP